MMTIYLVRRHEGTYDDYSLTPLVAFSDEAIASEFVRQAKEEHETIQKAIDDAGVDRWSVQAILDEVGWSDQVMDEVRSLIDNGQIPRGHSLDPFYQVTDDSLGYDYEEIVLDDPELVARLE